MNLGDLTDLVSWLVNFNSDDTDQAFAGPATDTNKHIHRAINLALVREVDLAMQHTKRGPFKKRSANFTWTASATTLSIPTELVGKSIVAIFDITDGEPGVLLSLNDTEAQRGLYQRDNLTWGMQPAPTSALTLVATYIGYPNELVNDGDIPELIPENNHELIAWSAADWLLTIADQDASPQRFAMRLEEERARFWKTLSMGSPQDGRILRNKTHWATNYSGTF